MRWLVLLPFALACSGASVDPPDASNDDASSDAAIDHKLGGNLDASDAADATPSCAFTKPPFTAYASCEPIADSLCNVASACGAKFSTHYSCWNGGVPPGPGSIDDFDCLQISKSDFCCAAHKCVNDTVDISCSSGKFGVACPSTVMPGDAGTDCAQSGSDVDAGATFYCCASYLQ
jgi:hypothetical protein